MKVGDLVQMPCSTLRDGSVPSVGMVIDETDSRKPLSRPGRSKRIGIMWADDWGKVYYEPRDWLVVISEAVPMEA